MGLLGEDRSQEFTKEKFMQMETTYNLEARQAVHAGIAQFKAELETAKAKVKASQTVTASPKVLVAVATKGGGLVNQHFGHAKEFMIYEVDATAIRFVGHRKVAQYCQGGYGEEASLEGVINTVADCQAVLAAKVGPCPQKELEKAGLQVVEAYDVIETVVREFYDQYVQPV